MRVRCSYDCETIAIGASISHAGACMTVVDKGVEDGQCCYSFEVSDESLAKTTMAGWEPGTQVNLERALTGTDELGGHLVTGHVDDVSRLISRDEIAGSLKLIFELPTSVAFAVTSKGSIVIDGVSLTVNAVTSDTFAVNVIPHTASVTTLGKLQPDDKVNLEIDLIARYVARYLENMKDQS